MFSSLRTFGAAGGLIAPEQPTSRLGTGAKLLALDVKNTTVDVGKIDALPGVIDALVQAVKGGELDAALTAAVSERKKNFNKRKSGVEAS